MFELVETRAETVVGEKGPVQEAVKGLAVLGQPKGKLDSLESPNLSILYWNASTLFHPLS